MSHDGMSQEQEGLVHVLTLCGQCSCGCPELFVDPHAGDDQRVVITDDFGGSIRLSQAQLRDIIGLARGGALDAAAG
jgi:hypothetical protein